MILIKFYYVVGKILNFNNLKKNPQFRIFTSKINQNNRIFLCDQGILFFSIHFQRFPYCDVLNRFLLNHIRCDFFHTDRHVQIFYCWLCKHRQKKQRLSSLALARLDASCFPTFSRYSSDVKRENVFNIFKSIITKNFTLRTNNKTKKNLPVEFFEWNHGVVSRCWQLFFSLFPCRYFASFLMKLFLLTAKNMNIAKQVF